jgi:RNA polymerase sigma-B factor
VDEIVDALYADENYRPMSLESKVGDGLTVGEQAGTDDPGFEAVEADDAFTTLARWCPERLEAILRMRYVERLTQLEIAERTGISQVHVSRLLARAHRLVRSRLAGA